MSPTGSQAPAPVTVAALYRFTRIDDPAGLRGPLERACRAAEVQGTLLLAPEGINGTIAGPTAGIEAVLARLRALPDCAALDVKLAPAAVSPFRRLKVRVKREIVTMGEPGIDPRRSVGTYVEPRDWNALIADPETIVIDTRNTYEVAVGSFAGAIDPQTASFRDFPAWFRARRAELLGRGRTPRVAMFCTGGIRCEKSTAFLRQEGVDEVYHLRGGILRYLEEIAPDESRWQGECFVFDERVAVGHGLAPGTHALCRACRRPVSPADRASPLYEPGASCPACHAERTEAQREACRERHRQEQLAAARGERHVGAVLASDDG
ncbi:rhodanese-related sulfurtransferase [Novosphingobium piscinae]|uniref:tRNA uridine(34) hydroxylase n=1 Tax=Novosphingobium piscinae TaxID=1507448 RepID=A0A7X1KP61_9SPHN|nr:rhodanese-related sulfurtransferase [Novosphingobium piscinae]MBC2668367.1 rhodanese-related sulfurtransferase [Novosphingobium piscinae]